jgi:hypothetical protein
VLNGKNMSPLATYRGYFIAFMVIGFVLGFLFVYASGYFAVPFFANVFLWGWLIRKLQCPRCHTPLAPTPGASLRAVLASYRAVACRHCGSSLSK